MICFAYKLYEIKSKILVFLADILFLGVILDLDKYFVLWQTSLFGRLS